MSVIINKMSVAKPVIVELADMPLDARTRCNNVDDFPNIETPFIGMLIYTIDDGKFWVVTKLKAKLIGSMSVENMQIDEYAEFVGGGSKYTNGEGIAISEEGVISADWNTVAKKTDIKTYSAGTGIKIENNVIACTVSSGPSYSAGTGISIANGVISCTVSGGTTYTAGTGISISNGVISCTVAGDFVSQSTFETTIGNINSILDAINGEVI